MSTFYFIAPGETLSPAQVSAGVIPVPVSYPTTAPADGYSWELGNPIAIQVNRAWQQNWVQVPLNLSNIQSQVISQIQTILSEKIAAGFTYNGVTVGINPSNGDIQNITAMAATAMANLQATALGITVSPWPTNFAWLPQGSGASLPLTPTEMITFGDTASHYYSGLILYAASLEQQVMAATTAADVLAINITTGWPTS